MSRVTHVHVLKKEVEMIWKSEKFGVGAKADLGDNVEERLKNVFDFNAPTNADPEVLTTSDVLDVLGVAKTKANMATLAKVLIGLVGCSKHCRHNGRMGRYYALPPRKVDFL